jgi:hypothetical protein
MAWLDDRIRDHPKIRRASPQAFKWWALALCYCSAHGTEGQLEDAVDVLRIPRRYVVELVELHLWDREADGSLWVHDWQEHNERRDHAIEERRAADRKRQAKHREKVRTSRVSRRDVSRDANVRESVTRVHARAPTPALDHDQEITKAVSPNQTVDPPRDVDDLGPDEPGPANGERPQDQSHDLDRLAYPPAPFEERIP